MLKKLNQKGLSALIIIVIVAIVAAIAVIGVVLYNRGASETLTVDDIKTAQLANYEPPYTVDATLTDKEGKVNTFKIETQDENTSRATISGPEGTLETITTADAIYTKLPGMDTWTKLPKSQDEDSPVGDFELSTNDINEINNNGVVVGSADCDGRACTELKYTRENGDEYSVFVDNATKKLLKVTGDTTEGMIELKYSEGTSDINIPSGDEVQSFTEGLEGLKDLNLDDLGL